MPQKTTARPGPATSGTRFPAAADSSARDGVCRVLRLGTFPPLLTTVTLAAFGANGASGSLRPLDARPSLWWDQAVRIASRSGRRQSATEPRLGLFRDVVDELRWTATSRKGWLIGLAGNIAAAAAYVGYTHFDPNRPGDLRIANIGTAVVVWVLSNTLNTNQLGADSDRVVASLDRGDSVPRILAIKNLALAVMLVPLAILISVGVRILVERWRLLPHALMMDVGAVFLWLGVGSVISVLIPYRPIALRARRRLRRTWPRWAFCLAVPDLTYFLVMPFLHLPYFTIYSGRAFGPYQPHFMIYSAVYLAIGLGYWALGLSLSAVYARYRSERLIANLNRSS
jgi:hypothetical protein